MPEAHPLGFYHPLDVVPTLISAETVPEIFFRGYVKTFRFLLMERAKPDQVFSLWLQLDSSRLSQPLNGNFHLQSL